MSNRNYDRYADGRRGNSSPPLGRENRRGGAAAAAVADEDDEEYVVTLPPRLAQRPQNRADPFGDTGDGAGGRNSRDERGSSTGGRGGGRGGGRAAREPSREECQRLIDEAEITFHQEEEDFTRRPLERYEMPVDRGQPAAAGYEKNEQFRRPNPLADEYSQGRRHPPRADQSAERRYAPAQPLNNVATGANSIPLATRNFRRDQYDDRIQPSDDLPAQNRNADREQVARNDPRIDEASSAAVQRAAARPAPANDHYNIREPQIRTAGRNPPHVEEQRDESYYDYPPAREKRSRDPTVDRVPVESSARRRVHDDRGQEPVDDRQPPHQEQRHQVPPERTYCREYYDRQPLPVQEYVYDQIPLRSPEHDQRVRHQQQRQPQQRRQETVYDEIPIRSPRLDQQRGHQQPQQPVRHVHYSPEPAYNNLPGERDSPHQQVRHDNPRQIQQPLERHPRQERSPVRQQVRQRPHDQQQEVLYDELPLESEYGNHQEPYQQRGQLQPPHGLYNIPPQRGQTINDEPPLRQRQELPPYSHQQRRHHQDSNAVYDQPASRQSELVNEDSYSNASTAPVGENRETDELSPPHETVVAAREKPSTPIPNQWNIRRIVPRTRERQLGGRGEGADLVEPPPGLENLAISNANDDWDSEITRAQQQAPPAQAYPGRGGRGDGNAMPAQQQHALIEPSNEQAPINAGYGGFEEIFEDTRSYRPPVGRGGFSSRGNFNIAGRRDYDSENFDDSGRRNYGGGGGGYAGYEPQGYEHGQRSRAPKDYFPRRRDLADIYNEDRAELNRHGNTLFDGDAEIEVEGNPERQHCDAWSDMNLDPQLLENIRECEYVKPRNIQKSCIPYIQEGFDVKCQAETGSGKTVAFLLPIIDNLIAYKEKGLLFPDGPMALIIAPTRELVYQLFEQALKLTRNTNISVACAYGQISVNENIREIKSGCNILCACVGRLLDLVDRNVVKLNYVKYLVIDEPDRLLHDFYEGCDILKVLKHGQLTHKIDRQTLLFSATLRDPSVQKLDDFINLDNLISIAAKNESNTRIEYIVLAIPSRASKFRYLTSYLKDITAANNDQCPKVLVFINRKVDIERVAVDITREGFPATTIHGDRAQDLREEAFAYFKAGKARVLVATDVCARGVDIHEMDYVINYDLPPDKTTFLQRCGRTGRTHHGFAVNFYCEENDMNMANVINEVIEGAGQAAPEFLRTNVTPDDYRYGTGYDDDRIVPVAHHQGFSRPRENANVATVEDEDARDRGDGGEQQQYQQQGEEVNVAPVEDDWN